MIASVRRLSKSIVGKIVLALFVVAIFASFALADMQGFMGGGVSQGTLVEVGDEDVTERDLNSAMQRRLTEVRQANPMADYAALAGDFDPLLTQLVQDAAIRAFAADQDMTLSKRLVDAEIAKIPATRGLDGKFSPQAYQSFLAQQKLTDADLRKLLSGALLQRLVLAAASANARIPVGMATPYASMLLEAREADVAIVPGIAFAGSVGQPNDADLATFYRTNGRRYMVPEQRVLAVARIGPAQVASVTATEQDIAAYYKANQATYAGKVTRVISQAVVPTKAAADAIAARARGGASFAAATAPAGFSAADISVGPQTRDQFAKLTSDRVAAAAFAAASGAVVGPVQSDLGFHVVKIDSIRTEAGRPLAAVRGEISTRLSAEKRKNALADLVTKVEDLIAGGSSFDEAVRGAGLTAVRSPAIAANGTSRAQPGFKFPADLAPALRAGFDLTADDDPVVETLGGEAGYALVAADQITAAAPAPLASIRDRVIADWKDRQARDRARQAAAAIAAKVASGTDLKTAMAAAGNGLPAPTKASVRRLQLAQMGGKVPPALGLMFSLAQGKSRMIADPEGRGFIIVKVTRITPGNAMLQPSLITQTQREFQEAASSEYATQFAKAIEADLGVKRNEKAIGEARKRIIGGGV